MPSDKRELAVLALCGSLRATSTNKTLLEALGLLAPAGVRLSLFPGLYQIPAFNPDEDGEGREAHPAVQRWRDAVSQADAVLISSPEYAHGMPGALKNALDWLVGSGEFSGKPVSMINASARGTFAQASLKEVLVTMNAAYLESVQCTVPLLGQDGLSAQQVAAHQEFAETLAASWAALCRCLQAPGTAP